MSEWFDLVFALLYFNLKSTIPGIPPKPPRPKGDAPTSGAGVGVAVVVVVVPAAAVVDVVAALDAEEDAPPEGAAPPCLITRWMVIPSLMLWDPRFSESFKIFPAKMRHRFSIGALLNFADMASLN